jgi:hypothetical protein
MKSRRIRASPSTRVMSWLISSRSSAPNGTTCSESVWFESRWASTITASE